MSSRVEAIGGSQTRPSHEAFLAQRYFASLDGLRCLSILAVIWVHAGTRIDGVRLTGQGHLGVDLFFAISGFLITTLLLREREITGDVSLGAFYARRSLRIFPLYYGVLALYIALVWLVEGDTEPGKEFFRNLPYFLTYTSNWFVPLEGRVIFFFAWSLATEEQFYLVWPIVEKLLGPRKALLAAIFLILARATAQLAAESGFVAREILGMVILLSVHPAILGGVILAHVLHEKRGFQFLSIALARPFSALVVLFGVLIAVESNAYIGVQWLLLVLLVGSVVVREEHSLAWLLRWRPIVHVGVVSYGMYLLHMLSYNAVTSVFGKANVWLSYPATVALAVLLATLTRRYYEALFLRLKEHYRV